MSNGIYDISRKAFADADIDLLANDIKVCLVRLPGGAGTTYTVNLATHEFLDDISGAAIVATSGNLANKTTTAGVFDADDITFTAVAADDPCALVIYQDTGNSATSRLIAYLDTGTNLPVTPVGTDIVVAWSSGANKIFKL